jgi:FAD/FMN-containing dehydrogenase
MRRAGGRPELWAELATVVGRRHVLTDPETTAGYSTDWTGRFTGHAAAVVRPGTTEEAAAVLACCRAAGVAIVPQGGNTGLAGGSVPLAGEVVVSLRRLSRLDAVDGEAMQVSAGAGVTIAALDRHAAAAGLAYAVDLAARDAATVGGTIATNAGGLRLLRFGGTRAQVVGIEAALGNGAVVSHLGGLEKDNTGYDLAGLLCGSEGTLGIVTAARLRLIPRASERVTALVGFTSVAAAIAAVAILRRAASSLEALELFLAPGMSCVRDELGLPAPLGEPQALPGYLVIECADQLDPTPELAGAISSLGGVGGTAVAVDERGRRALWAYRERIPEAIAMLGTPHKMDVTVPLGALLALIERAPGAVESVAPGARTILFGHAADGNLHVNVVAPGSRGEGIDGAVYDLASALGGSISAEHGIGTAKKSWLHLCRSQPEIDTFRAIKKALDPDGVCNPNALLPDPA